MWIAIRTQTNSLFFMFVGYANGMKTLGQQLKPVLERLLAQREVCVGWLLWIDTSEVFPVEFYQRLTTISNTTWVPAVTQEPDSADLRPSSILTMRNNTRSLCPGPGSNHVDCRFDVSFPAIRVLGDKDHIPLLCLSANQGLFTA